MRFAGNQWFDGLEIMDHADAIARMNRYPVIRLNMSRLRTGSYDDFYSDFVTMISDTYSEFEYLTDCGLIPTNDRELYLDRRPHDFSSSQSLTYIMKLCEMLEIRHGIKPVVLIDEYDDPINGSFGKGSHERILEFVRMFYQNVLKTNRHLAFAVVTGVMQIAQASIFSGLNSLYANNILSKAFDERYGFTSDEVRGMCTFYGHPEKFIEAKDWYDGYRFGEAEIYNPWSLLSYIDSDFTPKAYWAGTSGNSILNTLLEHTDERTNRNILQLANGSSISVPISQTVAMSDIEHDSNSLFSVMVAAGYLNAIPSGNVYELSIPNREMRGVFASVMERRIHSDAELAFGDLFDGLEQGDEGLVRSGMQRILDESIPFILLTQEKDYELIIGAAAMSRLGRYTVSLEKESGNGRADIVMVRNSPQYPDIVLELKRARSSRPEVLETRARDTLEQIKDRSYYRRMDGRILLWGIAFRSKDFGVAFEETVLPESGRSRPRTAHIPRIHRILRRSHMVEFLPFEGLRPNLKAGEHIADRVSPPYDVISPEHLEELRSKPCNITRLTLSPDADKRYHGSRKELEQWIADNELKQDPPSFYLYEQNFDDHGTARRRTGIVGILRTERYEDGNIIPHEETFSKVKADRLNLLRDMEAHLESIFGIFDGLTPGLSKRLSTDARLVYRYVDPDDVEHRYYRVSDPEVCKAVTEELKDKRILIADGHHRYETALNYALENPDDPKKQYVLATLVPADDKGLVIWPTHRLIKSGNISEKNAVKGVEKALRTVEVPRSELVEKLPEHLFGMVFRSGKCLLADCDDDSSEMYRLDTYATQQKVLYGVYKSDEGKAEVSYDAELPDVLKKMDAGEYDAAIILNPPKLQTIWDLAMDGKRMPKKTTFFFPKIWSGFVIYRMD